MTISVGMSIWRFVRNAVLLLLGAAAGTIIVLLITDYLHNQEVARVKIAVANGCGGAPRALAVTAQNTSSKTVNSIYFRIEGRKPGHSTDLVEFGGRDWDRIIKPGEAFTFCWGHPDVKGDKDVGGPTVDKSQLEWTVRLIYLTFAEKSAMR